MPLEKFFKTLNTRPLSADIDECKIGPYCGYAERVKRWLNLKNADSNDSFRIEIIGHSVDGAPLVCLRIGDRHSENVSVAMAGIHPMEWIGVEVLEELALELLRNPPIDREVILFPLVNVDGYRLVESDLRNNRRKFRRGNKRGIDLNRNWPTHFQKRARFRSPFGINFGGHAPGSEPEVASIINLMERIRKTRTIEYAVSLHSFGKKILLPFGGRWKEPPRLPFIKAEANALLRKITPGYSISQVSRWFPGLFAHGIELDYLHDPVGATAVLIECSAGGISPGHPTSILNPFQWFNPKDAPQTRSEIAPGIYSFLCGAFLAQKQRMLELSE